MAEERNPGNDVCFTTIYTTCDNDFNKGLRNHVVKDRPQHKTDHKLGTKTIIKMEEFSI